MPSLHNKKEIVSSNCVKEINNGAVRTFSNGKMIEDAKIRVEEGCKYPSERTHCFRPWCDKDDLNISKLPYRTVGGSKAFISFGTSYKWVNMAFCRFGILQCFRPWCDKNDSQILKQPYRTVGGSEDFFSFGP